MERQLYLLKEARRSYKSINMPVPMWIFQLERLLRSEKENN